MGGGGSEDIEGTTINEIMRSNRQARKTKRKYPTEREELLMEDEGADEMILSFEL